MVEQQHGSADPGVATDRADARLQAFALLQSAQVHDMSGELAAAHEQARARHWPEVERLLLYADLAHVVLSSPHPDALPLVERLADSAQRDGDQAMLAAALSTRAEMLFHSGDPLLMQQADADLARATALLDLDDGPAAERVLAHVGCGIAYSLRELWEIETELYDLAARIDDHEVSSLTPVLAFNRAESYLRVVMSQVEAGEDQRAAAGADDARAAMRAALDTAMPEAWRVEVEGYAHLLEELLGACPGDTAALRDRVRTTVDLRVEPTVAVLDLADAWCAARAEEWDGAAHLAERARAGCTDDYSEGVRRPSLHVGARAERGRHGVGELTGRYLEHVTRRHWLSRQQVLGAARSALEASRLRVERDLHMRAALVDELTGLGNRRSYSRRLQRLREHGPDHLLGAVLVDLDSFKPVNDAYGHATGDIVLARIAAVLAAATRAGDHVARIGGDEFVVLLDGVDLEAAERRADELLEALAAVPWEQIAHGLRITASLGVAAGAVGDDPEDLVRRADTALYAAKARGGGVVAVEPGAGTVARVRRSEETAS